MGAAAQADCPALVHYCGAGFRQFGGDRDFLAKYQTLISHPFMNILIENSDTLEYLMPTGQWTKNPLVGKSFPTTRTALRMAKQEAIGRFNIVCHIPSSNQFVNLDHGRGTGQQDAPA
jgi:hypothetical protein